MKTKKNSVVPVLKSGLSYNHKVILLLVAAGKGVRAKTDKTDLPKPFVELAGSALVVHSILPFLSVKEISHIIVMAPNGMLTQMKKALFTSQRLLSEVEKLGKDLKKLLTVYTGGELRQDTVKKGVKIAKKISGAEYILIHDSARPFVSVELVKRTINSLENYDCVSAARELTEAIARKDSLACLNEPVHRDGLVILETPQAFKISLIEKGLKSKAQVKFYDEASLITTLKLAKVKLVIHRENNLKITFPEDFETATALLKNADSMQSYGIGFDIHQLAKGNGVKIAATFISCDYKTIAHSDGDVVLHALADAIYSSVSEPDIGVHFPPNDAKYKGISSEFIVQSALSALSKKQKRLFSTSIAIIAETPKIAPHVSRLKENLSKILKIPKSRIGITATTHEKLGPIGAKEAVAALAIVSICDARQS